MIPETIKKRRLALGLTQKELAEQAGLLQAEISRWENGTRKPNLSQLEKLAAVIGPITIGARTVEHYLEMFRTTGSVGAQLLSKALYAKRHGSADQPDVSELAEIIRELGPESTFTSAEAFRLLEEAAGELGAPHKRDRLWVRAELRDSNGNGESARAVDGEAQKLCGVAPYAYEIAGNTGRLPGGKEKEVAEFDCQGEHDPDATGQRLEGWGTSVGARPKHAESGDSCWWTIEPSVGRVANGVASRVDRLKCIGNGQVPGVAAAAWEILKP